MSVTYTPKTLAKLLGVTPRTVINWCNAGRLAGDAEKVGGVWVITWSPFITADLPAGAPPRLSNGQLVFTRHPGGRPLGSRDKKPRKRKGDGNPSQG